AAPGGAERGKAPADRIAVQRDSVLGEIHEPHFGNARRRVQRHFDVTIVLEGSVRRSEEHTSELQLLAYLVCRLLLEKKNSTNSDERKRKSLNQVIRKENLELQDHNHRLPSLETEGSVGEKRYVKVLIERSGKAGHRA